MSYASPQPNEWFAPSELTGVGGLPGTKRQINNLIKAKGWQPKRKRRSSGGGWEYHISALPGKVQADLTLKTESTSIKQPLNPPKKRESDHLWSQWERSTDKARTTAQDRLKVVHAVKEFVGHGMKQGAAKRFVSAETGLSVSTIGRWLKLVKGYHKSDWVAVLLPGYTGRTIETAIPMGAWDYFKSDYLRLSKPAASACYSRLESVAQANGWELPSLKTFLRKLHREVPKPVIILKRDGKDALSRSYPPQERDHSFYHALEAVNADGHKFDVFVKFPDGEIGRPVMVAWQDIYSGKILSWRLDKTENTDSVRLSFGDMVQNFGITDHAYLDNGRGFASKWMTGGAPNRYRFKVKAEEPAGIMIMMGVTVHWCTPYHGQSKPIERAFLDLCCEYIAKHPLCEGAYTGNNPTAKPENYGTKAVEFDTFQKLVGQEVIRHNARQGRRSKVCSGRSFDEVFEESYARSQIRKATDDQRRLWMLAADSVTASRYDGSVSLDKNRYYCDALSNHMGSKVVVRFDPKRLHESVFVYTLKGSFIGKAECIQAAGFGDSKAAREYNRIRNQRNKAVRKQAEAEKRMHDMDLANLIPGLQPPETPITRVVKPQFKKASGMDFDSAKAFSKGMQNYVKANERR